ncbi:unnamed protein product [Spirodela intermedia]|uniref:Uncharacterized protein n=1 Tax=Spirodela intermedia TaxID=51605 RepID=A0A7I8IX81_SPIIN|nr:unnamed protein product [Spirodela intermedia]CAA6662382.1 unnamed protein product [Spirodela intermedia]
MSEPPFVPRERLKKYQEHFQGIQKHTFLKGRYDKITSGRGIYNMSHGIGKKE